MRLRVLAATVSFTAALLLAACSKVTPENFARLRDGMTEQEVSAILGSPTESSSTSLLGISGTTSKWVAADAVITVRFVNGKAALRNLEKPAAKR